MGQHGAVLIVSVSIVNKGKCLSLKRTKLRCETLGITLQGEWSMGNI